LSRGVLVFFPTGRGQEVVWCVLVRPTRVSVLAVLVSSWESWHVTAPASSFEQEDKEEEDLTGVLGVEWSDYPEHHACLAHNKCSIHCAVSWQVSRSLVCKIKLSVARWEAEAPQNRW
jgi:hypothetical protein